MSYEPRRFQSLYIVIFCFVLVGVPSGVLAQTSGSATTTDPSPTPSESAAGTVETAPTETAPLENTLAPSEPITEENFNLPEPSTWQFFKRWAGRTFTFDETKRLELDVERTNLMLLVAQREEEQGDTEHASEVIERFDERMEELTTRATELADTLAQEAGAEAATALLEGIQQDRVLQAGLVEQLATSNTALKTTALTARTKALRDLMTLMTVDEPDPTTFAERMAKIASRLYEREGTIASEFTGTLALLEELDGQLGQLRPNLKIVLGEFEAKQLDTIKDIDPETIGQIARTIEGGLGKSVLVLEALLGRVPEAARKAIETRLESSLERFQEQVTQDPSLLKRYFNEERHAEFQGKVLDRMADSLSGNAPVRQLIEAERKASQERAKEWEQKAEEFRKQYGAAPSDVVAPVPLIAPTGGQGANSQPGTTTPTGTRSGTSGNSSTPNTGSGSGGATTTPTPDPVPGSGAGSTYTPPASSPGSGSGSSSSTPAATPTPSSEPGSGSGSTYTPPAGSSGSGSGSGSSMPTPTPSSGSGSSGTGSGLTTPPSSGSGTGSTTTPPSSGSGSGSGTPTPTPTPDPVPGSGSGSTYTPPAGSSGGGSGTGTTYPSGSGGYQY